MPRDRFRIVATRSVPIIALLATGAYFLPPRVLDRTRPPDAAREASIEAHRKARDAGADRWAAPAFDRAEGLFESGLAEYRRQELRIPPLRDFRTADSLFAASRGASEEAADLAARSRRDGAERANADLRRAETLVLAATAFASRMPLDREDRGRLRRCREALARARQFREEEGFAEASRLAREAAASAEALAARCVERAGRYAENSLLRKWRAMAEETVDWSRRTKREAIVVVKAAHRLTLYRAGRAVKTYSFDGGYNTVADKLQSGDRATPEGKYSVIRKKGRGESRYHKALLLDYPNGEDRRRFHDARRAGLVGAGADPGGLIEIHGEGGRGTDWTNGCVALSNGEMDELFDAVGEGTPVTIIGSDGRGDDFALLVDRFRSIAKGAR